MTAGLGRAASHYPINALTWRPGCLALLCARPPAGSPARTQGFVTLREFKAGVPPLGPGGEAAKEYIFNRVDQLVNADSKLDQQVRGAVPKYACVLVC